MSPTRYGVITTTKTSFLTRIQSVRTQRDSEMYKYWTRTTDRLKKPFDVDSLVRSTQIRGQNNSMNASINQTEWIHLYTVGSNLDVLANTPNFERSGFNKFNNIAHIYIGGQRGILKDVSFSRTQIPGKLEAALAAGNDNNAIRNLLFQNKYEASIELFGNPVFKPGMLMWLDPTALGLGSVETYGKLKYGGAFRYELGIGGS